MFRRVPAAGYSGIVCASDVACQGVPDDYHIFPVLGNLLKYAVEKLRGRLFCAYLIRDEDTVEQLIKPGYAQLPLLRDRGAVRHRVLMDAPFQRPDKLNSVVVRENVAPKRAASILDIFSCVV